MKFSNHESGNENIVKFKTEEILLTRDCIFGYLYMSDKSFTPSTAWPQDVSSQATSRSLSFLPEAVWKDAALKRNFETANRFYYSRIAIRGAQYAYVIRKILWWLPYVHLSELHIFFQQIFISAWQIILMTCQEKKSPWVHFVD